MIQQFDFAIVSGVSETEIQQIKKKHITDRIRESVDIFGSQPERLGSIIMTAVTALALLISKVLDKARELSAKFLRKKWYRRLQNQARKDRQKKYHKRIKRQSRSIISLKS